MEPKLRYPRVFVSYSWDSAAHKSLIKQFAHDLRMNGVDALLDQWKVKLGSDIDAFIGQMDDADFIVVVGTPGYVEAIKRPSGGVAWEQILLTSRVYDNLHADDVIPLVWDGNAKTALPSYLRRKGYVDFSDRKSYRENIEQLLLRLHNLDETEPSIRALARKPDGRLVVVLSSPSEVGGSATKAPPVQPGALADIWSAKNDEEADTIPGGAELGVIVAIDVIGSSMRPDKDQHAINQRLVRFVDNHVWMKRIGTNAARDHFLDLTLICSTQAGDENVLNFCAELIQHMAEGKNAVELRIAVHEGRFSRLKENDHSVSIAGSGPGIAVKLLEYADADHLVVSQAFLESWAASAETVAVEFYPPWDDKPIEVVFPKGKTQKFRIYVPPAADGASGKRAFPRRILLMNQADALIHTFLDDIDDWLRYEFSAIDTGLTANKLKARLTIFAPDPQDRQRLRSTEFRHGRYLKRGQRLPGKTTYAINGKVEGPLGRAFVDRKPVILAHLPDYANSPAAYRKAISRGRWSLDDKKIDEFGRHARCYLAVPFGLDTATPADGVICIDYADPLEKVPLTQILKIVKNITAGYSIPLSALWHLRGR